MASSANNNKRKRPSPQRPSGRTPVEEALREEKEREMKVEIGTILFVALMVLFFLCNFHIIGAFGDAISGFFFGVFGLTAYIAPIVSIVALFFYRANKNNRNALKKLWASVGLFFLIGIICDMAGKAAVGMEKYNFGELYKICRDGRKGGGLISGSLAYLIKSFLGNVGLVLLLILGILICLILITEKSFINLVKDKGIEIARKGKDYSEEIRDRRLLAKENRNLLTDRGQDAPAPSDKALNVRDKLRRPDAEAPIFEEGTYVEMPPMPAKPDLDTGYKPNMRDSLKAKLADSKEKMAASKEKHEIEKKLNREAKENDSILQVAGSDGIHYGGNHSQEIHEIAYDDYKPEKNNSQGPAYDVNYEGGYDNNNAGGYNEGYDNTYDNGYYENPNDNGYYDNGSGNGYYEEQGAGADDYEQQILNYKIQNGETMVDMYGRPVFNFEKQEIRSSHSVEVKEQFSALEGNYSEEGGDYYNDDEDILENKDEDILSTYEQAIRKEEAASKPKAGKPKASFVSDTGEDSAAVSAWKSAANSGDKTMAGAYATATRIPAGSHDAPPERSSYGSGASGAENRRTGSAPATSGTIQYHSNKPYEFPPISLLKPAKNKALNNARELEDTKYNLQETLRNFGVNVDITEAVQGPSVTRYEMTLEPGTKVSKILGLSDDIKLSLASADIRIEAPIPGKSAVGIEVPNKETSMVSLRELFESKEFKNAESNLSFAVGKNIGGDVIVTDIGKMPHVLIAGATGSGKSVCINTLIMSLIYKSSPEDVQLIMVDPKVVELSVYNGIPHLMLPVVTDPKKAAAALAWGVKEMEERYKKFADLGVRDLKGYNDKVKSMSEREIEEAGLNGIAHFKLPKIVIIIDELADLMMVCGKEVEEAICRLAQLARACGIHLVVATQRPSVDVITGLIKANMPSRMAFAVSSGVDSRTILDTVGAEKLLGKGDMLFYPQGKPKPERVQGAFVSDEEVSAVVDFLKAQRLHNEFAERVGVTVDNIESAGSGDASAKSGGGESDGRDELFAEAGRCIINSGKCSIGYLQRMLKIGFNRAARIMDSLSEEGVVGPESGTKAREILMTIEEFEAYLDSSN